MRIEIGNSLGEISAVMVALEEFSAGADLEKSVAAWSQEHYRLGDFGTFDEGGNIVLVGRGEDLIIRGGQNIVPAELSASQLALRIGVNATDENIGPGCTLGALTLGMTATDPVLGDVMVIGTLGSEGSPAPEIS